MHFPTLKPSYATSTLALAICLACAQAAAVEPATATSDDQVLSTHAFAIARQPLANALDQLSEQSGLQIAYASGMAQGIESPGVNGRMSTQQALQELLAGSRLGFERNGPNAVLLTPCPKAAAAWNWAPPISSATSWAPSPRAAAPTPPAPSPPPPGWCSHPGKPRSRSP